MLYLNTQTDSDYKEIIFGDIAKFVENMFYHCFSSILFRDLETVDKSLLDQQQRLALQDKKLLDEYKSEINDLKALKMPTQETEFKHLDNQYKDEVNALKEKLENLQEQIKDQKRIEEQEKPRKWWGLWRK